MTINSISPFINDNIENLKTITWETSFEELSTKKVIIYKPKIRKEKKVIDFYVLKRLNGTKTLITFDTIKQELGQDKNATVKFRIVGEKIEKNKGNRQSIVIVNYKENINVYPPFGSLISLRDVIGFVWVLLFLFFIINWGDFSLKETVFFVNTARTLNYIKEKVQDIVSKKW